MEKDVVLTMRGIYKEFPGVKALQNVDFTLRQGEVHALMGENGAGKSTLVKVLTGVHEKDAGEIRIAGREGPVSIRSPQDAQNLGISTVYQEITLCPNLTVAENMYIGRGNYKFVNRRAQEKKASILLEKLNIPAKAGQQLGNCSLAIQQMVAIARAVDMDCKVPFSTFRRQSRRRARRTERPSQRLPRRQFRLSKQSFSLSCPLLQRRLRVHPGQNHSGMIS